VDSGVIGSEDCLYLSIYTPYNNVSATTQRLPVMVFFHSGAYNSGHGTNDFGPQYLLDKRIILVVVNYRLGRLGFLSLEDETLPGNYGMKDQVLSLMWVKSHIDDYGGDSDKMTIYGESAGSCSTSLHLISPLSKGLFRGVISSSAVGTSTGFPCVTPRGESRNEAQLFINKTGCARNNSLDTLECLKNLPSKDFFTTVYRNVLDEIIARIPFRIGVVVERTGSEGFLVTDPEEAVQKPSDVPWIVGLNSEDGGLIAEPACTNESYVTEINQNYLKWFPQLYNYEGIVSNPENTSKTVRNFYYGDNETLDFPALQQSLTDRVFLVPTLRAVELYKGPTYLYYYAHQNELTYNSQWGTFPTKGAAHQDDLLSIFYRRNSLPNGVVGTDRVVSDQLVYYWTNFVIYRDPNGGHNESQTYPIWPLVTERKNAQYIHIQNGTITIEKNLRQTGYDFWKSILF